MLTKQEEAFLTYWENNRDKEKKLVRKFFIALPLGLLISGGIFLCFDLNWYERANMEANSSSSPYVLLIAIIGIVIFTTIFYKKYQWDMNEQRYQEILYKKNKGKNNETITNDQNPKE